MKAFAQFMMLSVIAFALFSEIKAVVNGPSNEEIRAKMKCLVAQLCSCKVEGKNPKSCKTNEFCGINDDEPTCYKTELANEVKCTDDFCPCGSNAVNDEVDQKFSRTIWGELCQKDSTCFITGKLALCAKKKAAKNTQGAYEPCKEDSCFFDGSDGKTEMGIVCPKNLIGFFFVGRAFCANEKIAPGTTCGKDFCVCAYKHPEKPESGVLIRKNWVCTLRGKKAAGYEQAIEPGNTCTAAACLCQLKGNAAAGGNDICETDEYCSANAMNSGTICAPDYNEIEVGEKCQIDEGCLCKSNAGGAEQQVGVLKDDKCFLYSTVDKKNIIGGFTKIIEKNVVCQAGWSGCLCSGDTNTVPQSACKTGDMCQLSDNKMICQATTGQPIQQPLKDPQLDTSKSQSKDLSQSTTTKTNNGGDELSKSQSKDLSQSGGKDTTHTTEKDLTGSQGSNGEGVETVVVVEESFLNKKCTKPTCKCDAPDKKDNFKTCNQNAFCIIRNEYICYDNIIASGAKCAQDKCVCMDDDQSTRSPEICNKDQICMADGEGQIMKCSNAENKKVGDTADNDFSCSHTADGKEYLIFCKAKSTCMYKNKKLYCAAEHIHHSYICYQEAGCTCGNLEKKEKLIVCDNFEQCVKETKKKPEDPFWEMGNDADPICLPKTIKSEAICLENECYCYRNSLLQDQDSRYKKDKDGKLKIIRYPVSAKCVKGQFCGANSMGAVCVDGVVPEKFQPVMARTTIGVSCAVIFQKDSAGKATDGWSVSCHYLQTCKFTMQTGLYCADPPFAMKIHENEHCTTKNPAGCVCTGRGNENTAKIATCKIGYKCTKKSATEMSCENSDYDHYICDYGQDCYCGRLTWRSSGKPREYCYFSTSSFTRNKFCEKPKENAKILTEHIMWEQAAKKLRENTLTYYDHTKLPKIFRRDLSEIQSSAKIANRDRRQLKKVGAWVKI